ncbi:hypothetical protein BKA69DRAFT_1033039 [Paraphysoderma sedebokerense]|nr:hypothetical protein BKA69DRAFT_1033039 [Paraphysoderma sedebokerense]
MTSASSPKRSQPQQPKDLRYSNLRAAYGSEAFSKVASAKVLMVGAGGIGCELLKNLVMVGFGDIELVDLDTIDISNLNRQFLFQRQHVSKSKAHVARESALKFNPHVNIKSHHGNIKDPKFNLEWFKGFDLVFNALDNLDARRHVNMMCMAAGVPLIDAGTAGFSGQSTIIIKGVTECYDCQPKPVPKSFPVCTIRSTPSTPIHCIVWAKNYLFSQLFGAGEDDDETIKEDSNAENAAEIENLKKESKALKHLREAAGTTDYARKVFTKVFTNDINRLLSMDDLWKSRKPPTPLNFVDLSKQSLNGLEKEKAKLKDQQIWDLRECLNVFCQSLQTLSKRHVLLLKSDPSASLSFDKDDEDSLDFVTATANLRATVFEIERKSRFDVKAMAGNIVPIIATTNAIVAGLATMQAINVLRGKLDKYSTVCCLISHIAIASYLSREAHSSPSNECYVCRKTYATVKLNPDITLREFLENVVQKEFGWEVDGVGVIEGERLLYDPDFDDNLSRSLKDLGIHHGSMVTVSLEDAEVENEIIKPIVFAILEDLCVPFSYSFAFVSYRPNP